MPNPFEEANVPEQPPVNQVRLRPLGAQWNEIVFNADLREARIFDNPFLEKTEPGKRGKELFDLILTGLKEVFDVDAVIAGGAVRDYAAGIDEPKDIDVFLPMKWEDYVLHENELGWRPVIHRGGAYKDEGGCAVETTARGETYVQGVKIDLIFTVNPLSPDDVKKFPIYAQRGVYDKDGLILTPECETDVANKTFTIDPTLLPAKAVKVLKKAEGWRKRAAYKEWKIVEPDLPAWWEEKEKAKAEEISKYEKSASALDQYIALLKKGR